ncbi:hypothetical protein [Paenibacillus vini]|uniref:Uncharacterized protein n=2 Tax=Paenibacillus TaxID=44249 RepID=A0ABQ4M8R8_9BACL|nr:hypothetical protein [Paenibacillus vini]GIP52379.1 hypothetical protein J42TS3_14140 [Paenibacillus vini]
MENSMNVKMFEKMSDGNIEQIDQRAWSPAMITALEHVNYIVVGGREFETVEGRLNVDEGILELLLVPVRNE